jgi:hypothetical protein
MRFRIYSWVILWFVLPAFGCIDPLKSWCIHKSPAIHLAPLSKSEETRYTSFGDTVVVLISTYGLICVIGYVMKQSMIHRLKTFGFRNVNEWSINQLTITCRQIDELKKRYGIVYDDPHRLKRELTLALIISNANYDARQINDMTFGDLYELFGSIN